MADYGRRPAADDPHRPIWDRAVRTRAECELVYGRWSPVAPEVRHAHNAATAAAIDRLPVRELNHLLRIAAPGAPALEQLLGAIRDRITKAVAEPADYLIDLIGRRPTKGYTLQSRWDDKATAIETVRHRNGLDPSDGIASRTSVGVLGGKPSDVHAATDWLGAARVVEHAINPKPIDRDELRHQAPRLRR